MTADDMDYYLRYCTDLLAVVSKIGQLYVQDFSDSAALSAVDQFESLATGLSSKLWQKLTITRLNEWICGWYRKAAEVR